LAKDIKDHADCIKLKISATLEKKQQEKTLKAEKRAVDIKESLEL